jgi:hypothetical protein
MPQWVIGMAFAIAYTIFAERHFAGRLSPSEASEGY